MIFLWVTGRVRHLETGGFLGVSTSTPRSLSHWRPWSWRENASSCGATRGAVWSGKTPKMDGENMGKPKGKQMDDLGGYTLGGYT